MGSRKEVERGLLQPPEFNHAPTPPPREDGGEETDRRVNDDTRVKWDLRRPEERRGERDKGVSREASPMQSVQQARRPKLRIVTPATLGESGRGTSATGASRDKGVDWQAERTSSLPSGSTTATGSGTPPSSSKAARPRLQQTSTSSSVCSSGSARSKKRRWHEWLRRAEAERPERPIPDSPPTPLHLPRRLSRLPSFFTRERLYLPQHLQRRDMLLVAGSGWLAALFTALGIFAAVRPQVVCNNDFLQNAVNALLPGIFLGAPYTMLVVSVGICGRAKDWIRGRYTPLLYVIAAALGRVVVGALIANLSWTVMAC